MSLFSARPVFGLPEIILTYLRHGKHLEGFKLILFRQFLIHSLSEPRIIRMFLRQICVSAFHKNAQSSAQTSSWFVRSNRNDIDNVWTDAFIPWSTKIWNILVAFLRTTLMSHSIQIFYLTLTHLNGDRIPPFCCIQMRAEIYYCTMFTRILNISLLHSVYFLDN